MWIKILLLFFVFSFLLKTDHSFDQDLGRHLKLGEIIWQTKDIPQTNLFSYTNANFPFINTHWLFEILAYLTSETFGLQLLLTFKIIIFLAAVYLTLKIIPRDNRALLLPIGFIMLHVLRERTELRPEIFSFFFTVGTYYILNNFLTVRAKSSTYHKNIYLLPLIQLVWINTHIYFFVGLSLQVIFILQLIYDSLRSHLTSGKLKSLLIIFILSALVSLINPNGLTGLLYPLNVTKNYGYTIVENQTIFFLENIGFKDPNFLFTKASLFIIFLSLIIAFLRRKFEIRNILLVFFGAILSLMNVRSFPYLVLLSLPAVMQNLGPIRQNAATKLLALSFGLFLLIESFLYLNGDYYRYKNMDSSTNLKLAENGKKALDFVIKNELPNPIYNNFDIGSYIIYRGYPKYSVFADGRPEAYPKEFFQNIYIPSQSDIQNFKELDQKVNFQTIIFSHTDQTPWGKAFLTAIVKEDNWKTVYLDDFMIILVKNNVVVEKKLNLVDLSALNTNLYPFDSYLSYLRLSLFLLQTQNQQPAQKFAEKGLSIFPESPLGNALFGVTTQNYIFW